MGSMCMKGRSHSRKRVKLSGPKNFFSPKKQQTRRETKRAQKKSMERSKKKGIFNN